MDIVKGLLLAVRFGLGLAALAALGYWGFTTAPRFEQLLRALTAAGQTG